MASVDRRQLLGLACLLVGACGTDPRDEHRGLQRGAFPTVVVLVDTLRADHLGCYGYDRPTSPNLDAFARRGLLFERCQAQSTWTKPTTATLLTGLYPSRHGATTEFSKLDDSFTTLAELLQGQGYRTAAFGYNPHIFGGTGFHQGFETFEVPAAAPEPDSRLPYTRAGAIVDRALEWWAQGDGRPEFLYLHLFDPHAPYDPPEPYASAFDRGSRGERDTYYMMNTGVFPEDLNQAERQHYVDRYDGEIAYTDAQIGRLLDALDLEQVAVVVVSDHGEELFDHGGWSHYPTMYQELLHVPLLASFPNLPERLRGSVVTDLALQVDLLPTLYDMLGLPAPPDLPGQSLLAKALGALPATSHAISESDQFHTYKKSVLAGRHKYLRTWSPDASEVLFDLERDPGEILDLSQDEVDTWAELKALLDEHTRSAPARYALRVRNGGQALATVHGYLVTDVARVEGSDLTDCELHAEGSTDWDGPFEFAEPEVDGAPRPAVRFTLRTAPGDVDGFLFSPVAREERLRIALTVDGRPVKAVEILIGPDGVPPASLPVVLDLNDPERYASPVAPQGRGDAGLEIAIWRTLDAAAGDANLSPEQVRALEAIGYMGED